METEKKCLKNIWDITKKYIDLNADSYISMDVIAKISMEYSNIIKKEKDNKNIYEYMNRICKLLIAYFAQNKMNSDHSFEAAIFNDMVKIIKLGHSIEEKEIAKYIKNVNDTLNNYKDEKFSVACSFFRITVMYINNIRFKR